MWWHLPALAPIDWRDCATFLCWCPSASSSLLHGPCTPCTYTALFLNRLLASSSFRAEKAPSSRPMEQNNGLPVFTAAYSAWHQDLPLSVHSSISPGFPSGGSFLATVSDFIGRMSGLSDSRVTTMPLLRSWVILAGQLL